jgi:hypothetical protein
VAPLAGLNRYALEEVDHQRNDHGENPLSHIANSKLKGLEASRKSNGIVLTWILEAVR